jgi:hypothetical protein
MVFAAEGALGAMVARDIELQGRKLGFPFLVGLGDFRLAHGDSFPELSGRCPMIALIRVLRVNGCVKPGHNRGS